MKISIVTISFNQVAYLRRCLTSVAGQNVDGIEHIVVDPGSTDGSRELIEQWPRDILVPILKPDSGPAEGLNHGAAVATGDIFMYLNADDELAPGSLSRIRREFLADARTDVVIGNGWLIDSHGTPLKHVRSDRFGPIRSLIGNGTFLQQATAYRTSTLPDVPFNTNNHYTWDLELMADCWSRGANIVPVEADLAYFRWYDGTISTNPSIRARVRAERRSVLGRHIHPAAMFLDKPLNLPARAVKRGRNLVWYARRPPTFPGLVTPTRGGLE